MVDFDLHNNDGRDWRDFPRTLLWPLPDPLPQSQRARPADTPVEAQETPKERLTFSALSTLYLAEQADQLKPASLRDMKSAWFVRAVARVLQALCGI